MPKITTEFRIRHGVKSAPPFPGGVHLTSLADFWEIADLGFPPREKLAHGKPRGRLDIRCLADDPRLQKILRIIARSGYTRSETMAIGKGGRHFFLKHLRTYTPSELDAAELLTARPSYPKYPMAELAAEGSDDSGWLAVPPTRPKHKLPFGHFDCLEVMVFAEPLKLHLEATLGIAFRPIPYTPASTTDRPLWQIAPTPTLPPCLLPRVTQSLEPFTEDSEEGALWDAGGHHVPVELRFLRSALATMSSSHAATTREKIGPNHRLMYREVVVTQAFRSAMTAAKIKGIEYSPVNLVRQ